MNGYTALHEHAAWLDISSRGRIRATGEDRVRLINAISTNDIARLAPGSGTYSFFLDAQGRILADSHIYLAEDHVLIDGEAERAEFLFGHLDRYIIMDDVAIEDARASHAIIAVEGPRSEAMVGELFPGHLPKAEIHSHASSGSMRILRTSLTGQPGLWIMLPAAALGEIVSQIEKGGAAAATYEDFRVVRVENQVPRYGEDFGEQTLPQESGQMHAVSFTKGCYLGQEIVERIRSQGQVRRRLTAIEWDTASPPEAGSPIEFEGKEAGRVTSPVFSPRRGLSLSFSILRGEAASPGATLSTAGISGRALAPR